MCSLIFNKIAWWQEANTTNIFNIGKSQKLLNKQSNSSFETS